MIRRTEARRDVVRGRVRLHGGGISPGEVRLRGRGASERKTPPGEDIRDIGPEVPRRCRTCGDNAYAPSRDCGRCMEDLSIVQEVSKVLSRNHQPPLGAGTAAGSGYRKHRAKAQKAQERIDQRRRRNGLPPAPVKRRVRADADGRKRPARTKVKVCPVCFTQRARSGDCLCS